jgi:alpha/beta superfamily hydrolase
VTNDLLQHAVTFANGQVTLAGSLAVPDRPTPCQGLVMVGGSGPADRNNDTVFPPIREHLVESGIAVLSYDKRGVGGSSGDWRDATIDDLASDSVAAANFLRAQPGVHAQAIGLFGHSEGGWVVLRAAARAAAAYVVTNGCPGMTPAAQDRYALANAMRDDRVADADVDNTLELYDRLVAAGRRDAGFADATRLLETGGSPSILARYLGDVDERTWRFLKRKQDHDPIPDVLGLRCAYLALFGGADRLVPVAESVHLISAAACQADRPAGAALTVGIFPGADHRARLPGGVDFAPGYLTTLSGWITGRAATAQPSSHPPVG